MSSVYEAPVRAVAVRHATIRSALGDLTVVASEQAVVGLYFPGHWHRPSPAALGVYDDVGFDAARHQVNEYLAGARQRFDVRVTTAGDERQERVWALVREIPYGETATYGDLARALADGTTPQEVGAAVGSNPVCLLVPCHRVVGTGGRLTGYAGGLARKQFLLDLEADVVGRAARLF
jgi:methylated-DNA-[protein]-cysteine S-methyltransferase